MGQFFKKVAAFGLLSASTCGVSHAQSPWSWPSEAVKLPANAADASLWRKISASTPTTQSLIGPSDFQFPRPAVQSVQTVEAPTANTSSAIYPAWENLVGKQLSPARSAEYAPTVAQQVNWDSISAAPPTRGQSPIPQEPTSSPAELGMVGPMDQVAPTRMQQAPGTSPAPRIPTSESFPTESDPTNPLVAQSLAKLPVQSTLIVETDFPQPGTEQVTPIHFPSASQIDSQPSSGFQAKRPPIAVSLLPLQAAQTSARGPEATLAEVVSKSTSGPQGLVLHNVRAVSEAVQPETIVPIDILPFNRLINSKQQTQGLGRTYDAASMTGPMADPAGLFARLHVQDDFRQQAFVPAGEVRLSTDPFSAGSEWMQQGYAWVTPTFYHRPLYFEQPNLERYGLGTKRWLQPLHSAAHFFGSIGAMPVKLLTQHPGERVYTLGNNRPGDCVPVQRKTLLGQSYPLAALRYFDDHSGYR